MYNKTINNSANGNNLPIQYLLGKKEKTLKGKEISQCTALQTSYNKIKACKQFLYMWLEC